MRILLDLRLPCPNVAVHLSSADSPGFALTTSVLQSRIRSLSDKASKINKLNMIILANMLCFFPYDLCHSKHFVNQHPTKSIKVKLLRALKQTECCTLSYLS